ncbi:helix-hairpin-helix domain-containing protein [Fulvivirga sedimenti]|uniref:Helix-hairpin-helix domain-containing protein n=1 Tax=Fulvivirga sedimenti TaxID=2879465 RepID=A0A9X1KX73_9BACT|nr:helix-hairpin-helix domain-containing protein [Fulvivirga sedimenti]MCA6075560.1 helix-hairpin-helix domain-containing protein [Fulvivirga sedimenti]MCA6076737.1 helix-hairpin-helix domain-containing protein [Fulvivirga sedimenti]MCA6077865.1 helix-hairpin-helix domain-containing protein [Fulvivirga sedimenti]
MNYLKFAMDFSMAEFRGILGLVIIVVIIDALKLLNFQWPLSDQEASLFTRYIVESAPLTPAVSRPVEPFMPDTVSFQGLTSMGMPENVASNLIAYRTKSGGFRDKEQIRSIYGMTDSLFGMISDHLVFKERQRINLKKDRNSQPTNRPGCPDPMDVNLADSLMLSLLHGIGPVLSSRIISYRSLLGGYVDIRQLLEVYGLKDETFEHIRSRIYVDTDFRPRAIPLKTGTYRELYSHPYLNSRQAVMLLRYRQHHGDSISFEALLDNPLFSADEAERLRPYLIITDTVPAYR